MVLSCFKALTLAYSNAFAAGSAMALVFPEIDPVAIHLGPLTVRWYGLMYLAGFAAFYWLGLRHAKRLRVTDVWSPERLEQLLTAGVVGIIVGGRLGEVLFYQPAYYLAHPLEIVAIWKGGMSFHGGLLGAIAAMLWYARRTGQNFWQVADFVAPLIPPGLGFGRIGNFINGELWGRPAPEGLPWAMIYPHVDAIPRHPSQLYQAFGEGIVLFLFLWWFARRPRPAGMVSAAFLVGYGSVRFLCEFFRNPDPGIFSAFGSLLTTAQWLSLAMVFAGAVLTAWARHRRQPPSS
jgi:phosphatidylglycerol:prolipoprotein diacylglycerol transferase